MAEKFTREQMAMCFDNVKDSRHWKNPISKTIVDPGEMNLECLREAIIYYTGSVPVFTRLSGNKIRVRAIGYFGAIGA